MSYHELKSRATELRQGKQFAAAIPIYEKIWSEFQEQCNEWDLWGYIYCLKQCERYEEAIELCKIGKERWENFQNIDNLYAWCLYFKELKNNRSDDEQHFLSTIDLIIELCNKDYTYSPLKKTILLAAKYLKEKNEGALMLNYLRLLPKEVLNNNSVEYTRDKEVVRELASELEQYYSYLTEALLQIDDYQSCIDKSSDALKAIKKFHYDNDIWLNRRIAKSYLGLEQTDKAIEIYKTILMRKKDWFIFKEIAEIYLTKGEYEQAIFYAVKGALAYGEPEKKVNLYQTIGDILEKMENKEKAEMHYILSHKLREEKGWIINDNLMSKMKNINRMSLLEVKNSGELHRDLMNFWKSVDEANEKRYYGVITTVLQGSNCGFIKCEDGNSYYFKIKSTQIKKAEIVAGLKVSFTLEDSFDRKKGKKTKSAVKIKKEGP